MNNNQNIDEEIDLRELWDILYKKKLFIFIFTNIITIGAIIFAYSETCIYEVKSNIKVGFIENELIADPNVLSKILNIVFCVEHKLLSKEEFVSEVSSIIKNKKINNFIEIKTQAITNDEALKLNKKVVAYLQNMHQNKIDEYIKDRKNDIKMVEINIKNLDTFETINLIRAIKLLKTQNIVQIDEKIKKLQNQDIKNIERQINLLKRQKIVQIDKKIYFYKNMKIHSINEKISFHTKKLKEYEKLIEVIDKENKIKNDPIAHTIISLQMVSYQNLILNSQNKIEDLKMELDTTKNQTIHNLEIKRKNILNISIKNLELKIENIKNITILNLQRDKQIMINDALRKLEYRLNVNLPNKKAKFIEKIEQLKYHISEQNIKNSEVIGHYEISNYPIKPKKKLIVVVAFVLGFIIAVFLILLLNFIAKEENKH